MSWIELKLNIPADSLEQVSSYLFAHGCEGINVTDNGIIIYFTTHRWSNEVRVAITEYIRQLIPGFSLKSIQVRSITDHDWNADWKKHFKAVKVTTKVVIRPPWEKYHQSQGELVITINPQMAFGTGHHESTKLVMVEMENIIQPGIHVLDVGTGSGILAILANKLGAESVLGIDNDMDAIKNANENVQLNNITGGINFGYAQLENVTPSDYDLVLANINRNTLLKYAAVFPDYIKKGGYLVISGILRQDEALLTKMYNENGFTVIRKNVMRDWLVIVFEMKEKKHEAGNN
jgi:ribosomal protein L11 methyltransferase